MSPEDMRKAIEMANLRRNTVDAVKNSPRKRTKTLKAQESYALDDIDEQKASDRVAVRGNTDAKRRAVEATASSGSKSLALFQESTSRPGSLSGEAFRLSNDGEGEALAGLLQLGSVREQASAMAQHIQNARTGQHPQNAMQTQSDSDRNPFAEAYEEGETTEDDEPPPRQSARYANAVATSADLSTHVPGSASAQSPRSYSVATHHPIQAAPHSTAVEDSTPELAPLAPLNLTSDPTAITGANHNLDHIATRPPMDLHPGGSVLHADASAVATQPQLTHPSSSVDLTPKHILSAGIAGTTAPPENVAISSDHHEHVAHAPDELVHPSPIRTGIPKIQQFTAEAHDTPGSAGAGQLKRKLEDEAEAGDSTEADEPISPDTDSNTQFTGVRRNKGGRFSARIKIGGSNKTAEEAAKAFDLHAIQNGRPVETLNFPACHGGPTVGQAYRKRKLHKLYPDPNHSINLLLKKLADVDRSNPGILKLTIGTLGVPEFRFLPNNKYSGVRQQTNHWEARIRFKDKLYSMGFYSSVEAAALAWDITAASLRRCSKLNFPEVSFLDLEQQLDALKCVISQQRDSEDEGEAEAAQPEQAPPEDCPMEVDPPAMDQGNGGGESDLSAHTKHQLAGVQCA